MKWQLSFHMKAGLSKIHRLILYEFFILSRFCSSVKKSRGFISIIFFFFLANYSHKSSCEKMKSCSRNLSAAWKKVTRASLCLMRKKACFSLQKKAPVLRFAYSHHGGSSCCCWPWPKLHMHQGWPWKQAFFCPRCNKATSDVGCCGQL